MVIDKTHVYLYIMYVTHTLCGYYTLVVYNSWRSFVAFSKGGGGFPPCIDKKGSDGKQVLKPLFRDLNSFFFSSLKRGFIGNDLRCFLLYHLLIHFFFFFFLSLSTLTRQSELEYSFSH